MRKHDEYDDIELVAWGGGRILVFWIMAGSLALALVISGYYWIYPWWQDMQTRGTEHGYAAVSSKKELLLKLHQDWNKLETQRVMASRNDPELAKTYAAQQMSIVNRMKIEAATLPASEVPSEVQSLLH